MSLDWIGLDLLPQKPINREPKAELLQLNCTQFPSLEIFVSKKLEIQKTKTTWFITLVLKIVYEVVLVFC